MKNIFSTLFLIGIIGSMIAQNNVGIGTNAPNAEAKLDIQSSTAGLLIPRMSSAQRLALADESGANRTANGMMLYDINLNKLMIYDSLANSFNGRWQALLPKDSVNAWKLIGNSGTNASTNFIGSTDSVDLVFRNNNNQNMRLFANGNFLIGDSIQGSGNKTFFDNTKAAFRTGTVSSVNWNKDSLGVNSIAGGFNTKATGNAAVSFGNATIASGVSSTAFGHGSQATGFRSFAAGSFSTASGNSAISIGSTNFASGDNSTAVGAFSFATGANSTAIGTFCSASGASASAFGSSSATGDNSVALGMLNTSSGLQSTTMGFNNFANATNSAAAGNNNTANGFSSTVVGQFNDSMLVRQSTVTSLTPLFIVGNGTSAASRSNAMVVRKDGKVGLGTSQPGARLHIQDGLSGTINYYPPTVLIEAPYENLINFISTANSRQGILFEDPNAGGCLGNASIFYNESYNKKGISFTANRNCVIASAAVDMVIDSLGRIGINTTTPAELLDVNGKSKTTNFQMTNTAGNNRYLKSDALGNASWDSLTPSDINVWSLFGNSGTSAASHFIGTTDSVDLVFRNSNNQNMRLFANGNWLVGDTILGPGSKTFFDVSRSAFRTGILSNTISTRNLWNKDSIGFFSFAAGFNSNARGDMSVAMGSACIARGSGSFASGFESYANNSYSTAMGYQNTAIGFGSKALGYNSEANGDGSISLGIDTKSNGVGATTIGNSTVANGTYSFAAGSTTKSNGTNSSAFGTGLVANGFSSLVVGQFNDSIVAAQTVIAATTPLFIVGNGSSSGVRKNAVVVQNDGDFGINNNDPLKKLHILGDGGKTNATSSTDAELVLEEAGDDLYMTILTDTNQESGYQFGNQFNGAHGGMYYNSLGNSFDINFRTNGNLNRMTIDKTGNIGLGTSAPLAKLEVAGGLILDDLNAVAITVDNQNVTVGNSSYLRLSSNATVATTRTIILSNGLNTGQLLFIECNELGTDAFEILDGAGSNTNLVATRTMTAGNVIQLIWNGADWLEVSYANN